jgi:hypothetical protein
MYGVVACGGMWRMPGGSSVTSWTERSGGYGGWPASSWVFDSGLALVAAGLATALLVSMPVGSGPPRGRFALGYGLVLPHTLPLAGRRGFLGAVLALIVASGWRVPPFPCRRSSWARPCWWRSFGGHLRQPVLSVAGWRSAATRAGSLYRLGGVLAGGGPSCAAGEVQHGEGWPWRQPMAGDPGARTAWCSAC